MDQEQRQAEDALEKEFGLYYLSDELPIGIEPLQQYAAAQAPASAQRLSAAAAAPAVADALRRAAADPHSPLVARLSLASNLEWQDEADWPHFQQVAAQILRHLPPSRE